MAERTFSAAVLCHHNRISWQQVSKLTPHIRPPKYLRAYRISTKTPKFDIDISSTLCLKIFTNQRSVASRPHITLGYIDISRSPEAGGDLEIAQSQKDGDTTQQQIRSLHDTQLSE